MKNKNKWFREHTFFFEPQCVVLVSIDYIFIQMKIERNIQKCTVINEKNAYWIHYRSQQM